MLQQPYRSILSTSPARRWIGLFATAVVVLGTPGAWAAPAPPSATGAPSVVATAQRKDPLSYFVTQFRSEFNPGAGSGANGNCGPACVLMAAMAYDRIKAKPAEFSQLIRTTRLAATGRNDPGEATSVIQLAKGARHFGLAATPTYSGTFAALKAHVQAGGMAITCIVPGHIDPSYRRSQGHYVLVRGLEDNQVLISDPGRGLAFGGIRSVPTEAFLKAWQATGNRVTLVGPADPAAPKTPPRS